MSVINPDFVTKLKKYGAVDINACYNCGNCTAICPLSEEEHSFPRRMLRASVLGLESKIGSSIDPWLCYYCGECSSTCPREANPGELMMAARRWLTAKYDWTGLAGLFYRSLPALIIAFIIVAAAVITVGAVNDFNVEKVMHIGHYFEQYLILFVFLFILTPNIFRMMNITVMNNGKKVPVSSFIKHIGQFFIHMFTQNRIRTCENQSVRWIEHMLLVAGYLGLLIVTVFLGWFGLGADPNVAPTLYEQVIIWLGYLLGGFVIIFTFHFVIERISKKRELNKFSHFTDWFFVIWLFLLGFTGFIVRILIDTGLIEQHFWFYMIHFIVIAQWGMLLVPFGKWTHFLYRSFAMYFEKLK